MRFLIIITTFTLSFNLFAKCNQTRAAFDIGSGSTKMVVAEVNTCTGTIVKILLEEALKVKYKNRLAKTTDNKFPKDLQADGINALKKLMKMALKFNPTNYKAVATSAFRKALNAKQFIKNIKKETNLQIFIIDQSQEALLGFSSAVALSKSKKEDIVVWDIGGGSSQISGYQNGKFQIYEGQVASINFKNLVIESVKGLDHKKTNSPNPLKMDGGNKALRLSKYLTSMYMPSWVSELFASKKIIGIGGVHYYSVRKQSIKEGKTYTTKQLQTAYNKRVSLTDSEIESKDYAATEITNMALVLGQLLELKAKTVQTMKIHMGHGLLISANYWK